MFWVVSGGFGWVRVVLGGFGWFRVVSGILIHQFVQNFETTPKPPRNHPETSQNFTKRWNDPKPPVWVVSGGFGGFGWFRVGSGGFGWFRVVSGTYWVVSGVGSGRLGGFGWFRVVPPFSINASTSSNGLYRQVSK